MALTREKGTLRETAYYPLWHLLYVILPPGQPLSHPLWGGKGGHRRGHSGTQALWRDARIILLLWLSLCNGFEENPIEPCVPAHGRLKEAIGVHATVAGRP